MTMYLGATDLRAIADKLEALDAISDIRITQMEIGDGPVHIIFVERRDGKYMVRGITDKIAPKPSTTHPPGYRGR